jgi:hypothetical protein
MTADERTAARHDASKGWSGDFSGVFFKTSKECDAFPSWREKPRASGAAAGKEIYDGGGGVKEAAIDKSLAASAANFSKLDVQFIGPNAHELAFKALHPEATAVPPRPDEGEEEGGIGGGGGGGGGKSLKFRRAEASAAAAAKAAAALDPTVGGCTRCIQLVAP